MSIRIPCLRLLLTIALAVGLVVSAAHVPAPALAAGLQAPSTPTPIATATSTTVTPVPTATGSAPAIGAPDNLSQYQVVTATSGLTVIYMPRQVTSGGRLLVIVRTVPRARVALTISFPDGAQVIAHRRAAANGLAYFTPYIAYQPQSSAETAVITAQAMLPALGLNDTIQGSVAVLQHIVLRGFLKLPKFVVAGRMLTVVVVSNHVNVSCVIRVTYPDGRVELQRGYTDAGGVLVGRFTVSTSDGQTGFLRIQADLSYNGVQRTVPADNIPWKVALRAPK